MGWRDPAPKRAPKTWSLKPGTYGSLFRWGRGGAFDEAYGEDLVAGWAFAGAFDAFNEHSGGGFCHAGDRLVNGAQPDGLPGGGGEVVEAEDGEVFRTRTFAAAAALRAPRAITSLPHRMAVGGSDSSSNCRQSLWPLSME